MTPDEIAELRALAGAAQALPWWSVEFDDDTACVMSEHIGITDHAPTEKGETTPPNARYIAAACNAVPRLCDEIERLRADVERLTRELWEAREALLYFVPRCGLHDRAQCKPCGRVATHEHEPPAKWTTCDEHKGERDSELPHAPAIRAAEGET